MTFSLKDDAEIGSPNLPGGKPGNPPDLAPPARPAGACAAGTLPARWVRFSPSRLVLSGPLALPGPSIDFHWHAVPLHPAVMQHVVDPLAVAGEHADVRQRVSVHYQQVRLRVCRYRAERLRPA